MTLKKKTCALALAAILALPFQAKAADYPAAPINVIVSLAPGNTMDILARLYAPLVSKILGQPLVVQNKPGAGGLIAAQAVVNAAPDGYTILAGNSGHAILSVMNKNLPFDPLKDFSGISMVADAAATIVVSPALHVKTLQEFVDLAKSKPGTLAFGSAGIGSATHLSGAYFAYKAGIKMTHVPYKDGGLVLTDMVSNRLQATFSPFAFVLPMVNAGKLQMLAAATPEDVTSPMAVPSARSQGVDYVYSTWYGFLAPSKMPDAAKKKLAAAFLEASKDQELQTKIKAQGVTTHIVQLGDFDTYIAGEMKRLKPVLDALDAAPAK